MKKKNVGGYIFAYLPRPAVEVVVFVVVVVEVVGTLIVRFTSEYKLPSSAFFVYVPFPVTVSVRVLAIGHVGHSGISTVTVNFEYPELFGATNVVVPLLVIVTDSFIKLGHVLLPVHVNDGHLMDDELPGTETFTETSLFLSSQTTSYFPFASITIFPPSNLSIIFRDENAIVTVIIVITMTKLMNIDENRFILNEERNADPFFFQANHGRNQLDRK